jgi:hypothetical protein
MKELLCVLSLRMTASRGVLVEALGGIRRTCSLIYDDMPPPAVRAMHREEGEALKGLRRFSHWEHEPGNGCHPDMVSPSSTQRRATPKQ